MHCSAAESTGLCQALPRRLAYSAPTLESFAPCSVPRRLCWPHCNYGKKNPIVQHGTYIPTHVRNPLLVTFAFRNPMHVLVRNDKMSVCTYVCVCTYQHTCTHEYTHVRVYVRTYRLVCSSAGVRMHVAMLFFSPPHRSTPENITRESHKVKLKGGPEDRGQQHYYSNNKANPSTPLYEECLGQTCAFELGKITCAIPQSQGP
jgi:hypothetical protein